MDRSEARRIVDESLKPMRMALGLNRWQITTSWGPIGRGSMSSPGVSPAGQCAANILYEHAEICLDENQMESKNQLLRILRHELLHIMDAHFELYRQQVGESVTTTEFQMLDHTLTLAKESVIMNLERMFDYLGLTPEALVKKGKKLLAP